MTRFFPLPILATVLSLVGIRMIGAPAPVVPPPTVAVQEPDAAPSPIVPPQGLWEPVPAPPPPAAPPPPPPAASKPEPMIIVLEPLPAPTPNIEIANNPVVTPQVTIIQAPVNNYYPVVEPAIPPPQEVAEVPVAIGVGVPLCAAHRRPGCCLPKPPVLQQDGFFKKIPPLPPTPRRARFEP
jgi:hypothetical protein